jgi:hypothetical protein
MFRNIPFDQPEVGVLAYCVISCELLAHEIQTKNPKIGNYLPFSKVLDHFLFIKF